MQLHRLAKFFWAKLIRLGEMVKSMTIRNLANSVNGKETGSKLNR